MEVVVRLQQQQLEASLRQTAVSQLKEARPAKKFSGSAVKRMDFEKHMKLFNEMMEIPGATKKQILNEIQHWFEGSAFKLVEADTLKKADSAVDDIIERLTKKFGMRQESALEMLEEVLQGKTIDEKDHGGILDFYARLISIHSLATEYGKAAEFENKLVVKAIIERKLPFIKDKWARKAVKHIRANGSELKFADFLDFIDDEQSISNMLSGYNRSAGQGKSSATAKVSATSASAAGKKEGVMAPKPKTAPGHCPRCDATHKLVDCPIYRELQPSERRKFNKNQGLCFKCLEHGHLAKTCTSAIRCDKCDLAHHPLVHPEPNDAGKQSEEKAGEVKDAGNA